MTYQPVRDARLAWERTQPQTFIDFEELPVRSGRTGRPRVPVEDRFWTKVEKTDTCWNWTGTLHVEGYGIIYVDRKRSRAHRISYELLVGPIPEGLILDHLCRNPRCVNPDHLEAVTDRENILRGASPSAVNARKTHCFRGHEFTPENTRIHTNGRRRCRTCENSWRAEWRRNKLAGDDQPLVENNVTPSLLPPPPAPIPATRTATGRISLDGKRAADGRGGEV